MKKFWFFSLIFIILGTVVWGQTTYTWNAPAAPEHNWADGTAWVSAPPAGSDEFPGKDNTDNAVIGSNFTGIIRIGNVDDSPGPGYIGESLNFNTLEINTDAVFEFFNYGTTYLLDEINIENLILNGSLLVQNAIGKEVSISITAQNGDIIIDGDITGINTVINITALNGDVVINGDIIDVTQLAINAPNGSVTIAGSINVTSNGTEGASAAVYVDALNFTASGAITPGTTTGQLCVNVTGFYNIGSGTVAGNRYHIHAKTALNVNAHLVYGIEPPPLDIPTPYVFIDSSDTTLGAAELFSVNAGYNIYIVNVGNSIPANTREVTFNTAGAGSIEIRGEYYSSGELILNPGTGGITLNNANVNLTGFNITSSPVTLADGTTNIINAVVTLDADVNFTGNAVIQFGNTVNGAHSLTVTGANVEFNGAVGGITPSLTSISVTTGTAAINADITTSGNQTYNGTVTLGADVNLTGNAGSIIRFGSTVNGGRALAVTNANAVFNGIVGPLTGINVTAGTSSINADITTSGNQTYNGAVTLTNAVNFTGSTVRFFNTVNGTSSLTVTSANIQFDGDVTTTGNQNYGNGTVTLTGARTFRSTGGSVSAGGAVSGTELTVNAGGPINLSSNNNNVQTVNLTGSGAITYNSSMGAGNNLDINVANSTGATGITTITELTGNIIVGNVTCYSLALDAAGTVDISGSITVTSPNATHGVNAAVYINAGTFTGIGNIVLNSTTGWVCAFIDYDVTYTGSVTGSRIHYHSNVDRHIVYTTLSRAAIINIPGPYLYIQANGIQGIDLELSTTGTGNIYIIDIPSGSGGYANTRDVSFTTAPGGIIEIRDDYYSSGAFVLTPGTGGIMLNDANIELTGAAVSFNTNTASLTLNGSTGSSIKTAANISLNNVIRTGGLQDLELEAENITLNETVGATAATARLGAITIKNAGTFTQSAGANIFATGAFEQTGAGNSVLSAEISANGGIDFLRQINLAGTVNLNSTVSVTLSGNVGTPVSGNIIITAPAVITHDIFANGITINTGPLNLIDNVTYTVPDAGGTVSLPPSVTSATGDRILTLAGGSSSTASLELGRTGTAIAINGDITIYRNSYVVLTGGTQVTQTAGNTLSLEAGTMGIERTTTLDTSAGSWHIGSSGAVNEFLGDNGDLVLGGGKTKESSSRLIVNNLDFTSNNFRVNNSGWAYIGVRNTAEITTVNLEGDFPRLIIEMRGNGNQNLIATRRLGSLHVNATSRTILSDVNNNLEICGEVVIEGPGGELYAGNNNITMYAGIAETGYRYNNGKGSISISNARIGRWENKNASESITSGNPNVMHAFQQNPTGKVEFKNDPPLSSETDVFFEIIGNTAWQSFICENPDPVINIRLLFSTHEENLEQHHHVFLNRFEMIGRDTSLSTPDEPVYNLTLTRYVPPGSAWYQEYDRSPDPPSVTDSYPYQQQQGIPISPAPRFLKNESIYERIKFWNFNLVSPSPQNTHDAQMKISHITVFFSHAWHQRIPISTNEMKVNIVPYYRRSNPIKGHFCYEWVEVRKIIYSFVEDANGNGKVDRIRVQTNVPLNGIFTGFGVDVEGYTAIGFETVDRALSSQSYPIELEDRFSFYIFLEEAPYLYDGQPIKWWVTRNDNSLLDGITNQLLVGDPVDGEVYFTINTIPPRVSYALTLPGHNQTYIQMSQPVSSFGKNIRITGPMVGPMSNHLERALNMIPTPSYSHILEYFPYGVPRPDSFYNDLIDAPPPEGVLSYLLELNSAPGVSELAGFPSIGVDPGDWHFVMGNLFNMGVRALDWNDSIIDESSFLYYPSPRYPIDWNYTGYRSFKGNSHVRGLTEDDDVFNPDLTEIFLPPYQVLTPEMTSRLARYAAGETDDKVIPTNFDVVGDNQKRRVTDVLISREPTGTDSENYFAWPVWARYKDESRHTGFQWDDSFWGQMDTDDGIIWVFNGTKFLQERDIILQARINNGKLNGFNSLSLFYGFNVPAEWRNPEEEGLRGRSSGGLWLPRIPNPLFNIVPSALLSSPGLIYTDRSSLVTDRSFYNGSLGFYPSYVRDNGTQNAPLFTFDLIKEKFSSGGKIDFYLRFEGNSAIDPNLFIARLDAPAGSIPNNWYQLVRPFSFDLQDVRLQRGGVTIRNNVINSDNREITYISYHLVRPGRVTVQVYTLEGTLVKSLRRNEQRDAGEWTEPWDGTNNAGRPVARGIYFIRIVAPDIDEIRKVMVIK